MGVKICHYDEIDPFYYRRPSWFSLEHRFQVVAIEGKAIVGSWMFDPHPKYRWIDSSYTHVVHRWRREGVALKMWCAGVEHYGARRVQTTIASWDGLMFLTRAKIELLIRYGAEVQIVNSDDWMTGFHRELSFAAVRRIGELSRSQQQKLVTVGVNGTQALIPLVN